MIVGYGIPAVATVTLTGGTWLSADQGAVLFDGKPSRASRIRRTGSLAITITLADAVVPGIIAILGLSIPPGVQVSAAGATGTTVRLPDGSVCAWLFPQASALVSVMSVEIVTTITNVDVGEIAIFGGVDVGISDGWAVATINTSVHARTKGRGQVNTICHRRRAAYAPPRRRFQIDHTPHDPSGAGKTRGRAAGLQPRIFGIQR